MDPVNVFVADEEFRTHTAREVVVSDDVAMPTFLDVEGILCVNRSIELRGCLARFKANARPDQHLFPRQK